MLRSSKISRPEELGIKLREIRESKHKETLVKISIAREGARLSFVFKDAIGESEIVRHLISKIEVEILDIVPTTET